MLALRKGYFDSGWRNILRQKTSDTVLYYPSLEGGGATVVDYSGNDNDGTITGATWKKLPIGLWYLDFDATDDVVDCASGATIDNLFASGATISCWMKPGSDGEGDAAKVFDKEDGVTGWWLQMSAEAGGSIKLRFYHFCVAGNPGAWITDNTVVPINAWSHVAVTYDNSNVANNPLIYVNGTSVAITETSTPGDVGSADAAHDLLIGDNAGSTRCFDGGIALVKAHSVIKTATQILGTYNRERFLFRV